MEDQSEFVINGSTLIESKASSSHMVERNSEFVINMEIDQDGFQVMNDLVEEVTHQENFVGKGIGPMAHWNKPNSNLLLKFCHQEASCFQTLMLWPFPSGALELVLCLANATLDEVLHLCNQTGC